MVKEPCSCQICVSMQGSHLGSSRGSGLQPGLASCQISMRAYHAGWSIRRYAKTHKIDAACSSMYAWAQCNKHTGSSGVTLQGALPGLTTRSLMPRSQGQGIMESLSSAAGGASAAIERLQRYMQAPPAGLAPPIPLLSFPARHTE